MIEKLTEILGTFEGITVIDSFGGDILSDRWSVLFKVAHNEDGWFALEFLAWMINENFAGAGTKVTLYPNSPPPHLNYPGRSLYFVLDRYGEDPEELAEMIDKLKASYYYSPSEVEDG